MGYFISGSGEFTIEPKNIAAAYAAVVALNNVPDDAKHGGSYANGIKTSSHFSWMPSDLSTLPTLQEVFLTLGFEVSDDNEGGLTMHNYPHGKTGQEEFFAAAVAPFVENGGYFIWDGEDGEYWKWSFADGKFFIHEGLREYSDGRVVTLDKLSDEWLQMHNSISQMLTLAKNEKQTEVDKI